MADGGSRTKKNPKTPANWFIQGDLGSTLSWCRQALEFMTIASVDPDMQTDDAECGRFAIMKCIVDALHYCEEATPYHSFHKHQELLPPRERAKESEDA